MSWDNPADYEYTSNHTVRDWGWEFIRRNLEYIAEWENILGEFRKKKESGDLYRELLGYPNDNIFLERLKPEEVNESFYRSQWSNIYNEIDPDLFESFMIRAPQGNRWELFSYQDPRNNELIPYNLIGRSEVIAMGVSIPGKIGLETRANTVMALIDLEKPLKPQIDELKFCAKDAQTQLFGKSLDRAQQDKKILWTRYIRCLDAHNSGVDRREAIKILFPEEKEDQPTEKWDETLKQAKAMVNKGWRKLMI